MMDTSDLSQLFTRVRDSDRIKVLSKDEQVGVETFLEAVEMINLRYQGVTVGGLLVLALEYLQEDRFPAPHFRGGFKKGALATRRVIESLL